MRIQIRSVVMQFALVLSGLILLGSCYFAFFGAPRDRVTRPANLAIFDPKRAGQDYDWAASQRNLEAIGRALQMYRADCEIKPVASRKSLSDAGLPPHGELVSALKIPPSTWWATGSKLPFAPSSPSGRNMRSNYGFPLVNFLRISKADTERVLASRGEDLPVLGDLNMYTPGEMAAASRDHIPITGLILRLSGKVERVTMFDDPLTALLKE